KVRIGYLTAALILLSVVSISIFVKIIRLKSGVAITSKIVANDISDVSDIINDRENGIHNNVRCNIIDLDSGSRAFADSGALVSDIKIEDKKVSVHVLKGAVSFSVAKKRQRSFIVNAGLADIVVTGTKFRVIRMENVVTVAVNTGSVYTAYNNGTNKTTLKVGQVAMVMKDTIAVISNDSLPDLPERKLLPNLLEAYDDAWGGSESFSKRTVDSLTDIMFTSGLSFEDEGDLIEHFSFILESKGRFNDALTVLQHHPEYVSNKTSNATLTKLRSTLLLKTGDTAAAVAFMENTINDRKNLKARCNTLSKLYNLYLKSHNVLRADTCLHQFVECTQKKEGIDKVIIDHAHLLRNASMIDPALFWYEYLLENFAESKYRKDAEYWVSDCIVQKSIGKNSALYNKSISSGR
ncbi:MAG TPA: FecR family protein, partial [Chitinispirillaceae bacterium]|nr:FecR family protein [Chitinispirillaceae bacterium]